MAFYAPSVGSTVAIGEIEGATLVTESETITSNDNDTTIPTSAAVKNYADAETATLTNKSVSLGSNTVTGTLAQFNTAVSDANLASLAGAETLSSKSISGALTLEENASIALDPAGSADGKYTGITVTGTGGTTIAFGDLIYLDPTDSRWELVDANAAAGADGDARGLVGMAVTTSTDGNPVTVLLMGIIRADAVFPALTIGSQVFASETAGDVTVTKPTTTDAVVRCLGSALTADEMFFNPSPDFITAV